MKHKRSLCMIALIVYACVFFAGCNSPAPINDENMVRVYVAHNAEQFNAVIKEFQERTGIRVEAVSLGTGDCLLRIQDEADAPICDVMWGGTTESLEAYKMYFQAYISSEDAAIPEKFKDPEDLWIGESQQPAVIMYNKRLVTQDTLPLIWKDLLDSRWKGMIASADPAASGSAYTLLCTMIMAVSDAPNYEKGWAFIGALYDNLVITSSSSQVYNGVANGEFAIGLTLEQLAWLHAGTDSRNVGMIYPLDGSSNVPDGVAMVKDCPHPEQAGIFIDFLLSYECQQYMSVTAGRRSIRDDVAQPEGLPDLGDIDFLDYNFVWAGAGKKEVLETWQALIDNK